MAAGTVVGVAGLATRRTFMTAGGIGVAAGCMGTWFEMSHGVVCIPVLTLPPLALPQQVAVGSTVVGVAARQILSAGLFAFTSDEDLTNREVLEQMIDVPAATGLATAGCLAALSGAGLSKLMNQRVLRRFNGACLVGVAMFIQWREGQVRALAEKASIALNNNAPGPQPEVTESSPSALPETPHLGLAAHQQVFATGEAAFGNLMTTVADSRYDWPRYVVLGAFSGFTLGFFGIGPAWILAPIMSKMGSEKQQYEAGIASVGREGTEDVIVSAFGSDERTRRTCCIAMVPPCICAAWRHMSIGHVPHAGTVAIPLGLGAILGSAIGGQQLENVPCDEEFRLGMSMLLFAHGAWSIFRPG